MEPKNYIKNFKTFESEIHLDDTQKLILQGKICPYCKKPSIYVDSIRVYGNKSFGMIYLCEPCKAWCGVYKNTDKSLGRLANAELRKAKKEAHEYFDKIWKLKLMKRDEAYKWLSKKLDIPGEYTHIGMFSLKTCREVVNLAKQALNDNRRLDLDFGAEPATPYYEI